MTSNLLPGISGTWPGGSAPWVRRHMLPNPPSQAGWAGSSGAHPPGGVPGGSNHVDGVPPHNAAIGTTAGGAIGRSHQQYQGYPQANPSVPSANSVVQSSRESEERGSTKGNQRDHQSRVSSMVQLEAEIKNAKVHNSQLQQNTAFLHNQITGQQRQISLLHNKIRSLEIELAALRATTEARAKSAPANPVPGIAAQPAAPAPAPAVDVGPRLPDQHQPVPHSPPEPSVLGRSDLRDLRPNTSLGSGAALGAVTEAGSHVSTTTPPSSSTTAPLVISPHTSRAESSPMVHHNARETTSSSLCRAGCSMPDPGPAQHLSDANNGNDLGGKNGGAADDVEANADGKESSVAAPPKKPRNSLKDFWTNSSLPVDDSPPASNTRNCRHRAPSVGSADRVSNNSSQTRQDSNESGTGTETGLTHVQAAAIDIHAEGTEATRSKEDESGAALTGCTAHNTAQPRPQNVPLPVLRRSTKGKEAANGRSGHLMDCVVCENALPNSGSIGRCEMCPRSFCARCLERALDEQGVNVEDLGRSCRTLLRGEQGDFFIRHCPRCVRGSDKEFPPPPQGATPMFHLLNELLRHDLSICFREPVDITQHPDYLETIGRENMMDLGTILSKLENRKYPRRRGPGQFLEDLSRIWKNCRRFAGCDELGQPRFGTTVPGIVRCALALEAMSIRFCSTHMSDDAASAWQESTWDFHRQKQERENAEARLKSLENAIKPMEVTLRIHDGGGGNSNAAGGPDSGAFTPGGDSPVISPAIPERAKETSRLLSNDTGSDSIPAEDDTASDVGGRKRKSTITEEESEGSVHQRRTRASTGITPETSAGSSADGGGSTPAPVRPSASNTRQQAWSPLDKLCDLATTFEKDSPS